MSQIRAAVLRPGDPLKIPGLGPYGLMEMNFRRWDLGMAMLSNFPNYSNKIPQLDGLEDELGANSLQYNASHWLSNLWKHGQEYTGIEGSWYFYF